MALLPPDDTRIQIQYLNTVLQNCKRGAAKAAATRARKKACLQSSKDTTGSDDSYCCGTCEKVYQEEADEDKLWIGCDVYDKWYCGDRENLSLPPDTDIYMCTACRQ